MGYMTPAMKPVVPKAVLDQVLARTHKLAARNAGELHSAIERHETAIAEQCADGGSYPQLAPLKKRIAQARADLREVVIARQTLAVARVQPGKDAITTEQPDCLHWSMQELRERTDDELLAAAGTLEAI